MFKTIATSHVDIPLSGSLEVSITTADGSLYLLRIGSNDERGLPVISLTSANPGCPLIEAYVEVRINGKVADYSLSNMATGLRILSAQRADSVVQAAIYMAVLTRLEQMLVGQDVRFVSTTNNDAWSIKKPIVVGCVFFPVAVK